VDLAKVGVDSSPSTRRFLEPEGQGFTELERRVNGSGDCWRSLHDAAGIGESAQCPCALLSDA